MARPDRMRRVAANEAVFRGVNERIEDLNRGLAEISDNTMDVVCECGAITCIERLTVPMDVYERVRSDSALFFAKPGHVEADLEDIVERTPAYHVVRKHAGEPERLAQSTDPRRHGP